MLQYKKIISSLTAALMLAIGGCGGSGGDTISSSPPSSSPPPAGSPPPGGSPTACANWSAVCSYDAGDVVRYNDVSYTALIPHTLTAESAGWTPDTSPQLWSASGTWTGMVAASTPRFAAPAGTWTEHWHEHTELLKLIAYNDTVAIYVDSAFTINDAKWIAPYMTRAWQYVLQTYGNLNNSRLTSDRLYLVLHKNKFGGVHHATVYDTSHDNRYVLDAGANDWGPTNTNHNTLIGNMAHLVQHTAHGRNGSPQYPLWKDWIEYFRYDVYNALGLTAQATAQYNSTWGHASSAPADNSMWFQKWFYMLSQNYGGMSVVINYFDLLGKHFPLKSNGQDFARDIGLGEFIHFMSAAAGKDLRALARNAFGGVWTRTWEMQFECARGESRQGQSCSSATGYNFSVLNSRYTLETDPPMVSGPTTVGSYTVGSCGTTSGNVFWMLVYESSLSRWCVASDVWDLHAADITSSQTQYFDYGDQVVTTMSNLFANPLPAGTKFTYQVETPNGGAHTGSNFGIGVGVTGDAFWNTANMRLASSGATVGIKGFWGYLLTLHEAINVWTGRVSSGWPTDWWADHRSPFPNSMDFHVMDSIGRAQNNPTLINAADAHFWRMADSRNTGGYDTQVGMFDNFFNRYGGYTPYVNTFTMAQADAMRWDALGANPSPLRTHYVIAYLQLGFASTTPTFNTDLTRSDFIAAGVGSKDTQVPDYTSQISPATVKAIADARCAITGARAAGVNVSSALTSFRAGNYAAVTVASSCTDGARLDGCICSGSKWTAPWTAAP
jgi:hypothetical protein